MSFFKLVGVILLLLVVAFLVGGPAFTIARIALFIVLLAWIDRRFAVVARLQLAGLWTTGLIATAIISIIGWVVYGLVIDSPTFQFWGMMTDPRQLGTLLSGSGLSLDKLLHIAFLACAVGSIFGRVRKSRMASMVISAMWLVVVVGTAVYVVPKYGDKFVPSTATALQGIGGRTDSTFRNRVVRSYDVQEFVVVGSIEFLDNSLNFNRNLKDGQRFRLIGNSEEMTGIVYDPVAVYLGENRWERGWVLHADFQKSARPLNQKAVEGAARLKALQKGVNRRFCKMRVVESDYIRDQEGGIQIHATYPKGIFIHKGVEVWVDIMDTGPKGVAYPMYVGFSHHHEGEVVQGYLKLLSLQEIQTTLPPPSPGTNSSVVRVYTSPMAGFEKPRLHDGSVAPCDEHFPLLVGERSRKFNTFTRIRWDNRADTGTQVLLYEGTSKEEIVPLTPGTHNDFQGYSGDFYFVGPPGGADMCIWYEPCG